MVNKNQRTKQYNKAKKSTKQYTSKRKRGGKFDDEEALTTGKEPGYNDVSWYAKNEQLLRDSASISYNAALGTVNQWSSQSTIDIEKGVNAQHFPGIVTLDLVPGIGVSADRNSPINIAATNVYSYVRYMNSGSKNYDAPDLMMYLLAMDQLYSFINNLKRLYGTMRVYNQRNWYYMRPFIEAQGFDWSDLSKHVNDLRGYINTLIASAMAFNVPASMPLFVRHSWLYSNYYADGVGAKAQTYIFKPYAFGLYDEYSDQKGGFIDMTPFTAATMDEIQAFGDDMIRRLQLSEDIGVMSGDILKAYGPEKLFKFSAVTEDYVVLPVYNQSVLSQIHNSRSLPGSVQNVLPANINQFDIRQDPDNDNAILCTPTFTIQGDEASYGIDPLLNVGWDDPTPGDTMIATRLTFGSKVSYTAKDAGTFALVTFGTEVIVKEEMFTIRDGKFDMYSFNIPSIVDSTATAVDRDLFNQFVALSHFDWHPLILSTTSSWVDASSKYKVFIGGVLGDINTYAFITSSELWKMNQTALLSLFDVPALGSV